jgi:thiamine kinase-like enzyme
MDFGAARGRIDRMFEQARSAVDDVDALPKTLIHGEFYASNVLVDSSDDASRIRPIDWETAGIGCGLLDLAALAAGRWSEENRQRLADAYFNALGPRSWLIEVRDPKRALRQCRLLLAMKWIGWSPYWEPPPEQRHDWLSEALLMAGEMDDADRASNACRSTTTTF